MIGVFGPSCAGKSTFITKCIKEDEAAGITSRVLFASSYPLARPDRKLWSAIQSYDRVYFHFNILELSESSEERPQPEYLRSILQLPFWSHINVLVSPLQTLKARASSRISVEAGKGDYRSILPKILGQYDLDVPGIYSSLYDVLCEFSIDVDIINTATESYRLVDGGMDAIRDILYSNLPEMSHAEMKLMIDSRTWLYHKVELPFGLSVGGPYDHSQSIELIKQKTTPTNATILDVGCAIGANTFALAKAGARLVRGIELRRERLEQACILKRILRLKNVEFTQFDLYTWPHGQWEVVLALNVIHHVPEPFRFIRRLAELSSRWLVIEVPQANDPTLNIKDDYVRGIAQETAATISLQGDDKLFAVSVASIRLALQGQGTEFCPGGFEYEASPIAGRQLIFCCRVPTCERLA